MKAKSRQKKKFLLYPLALLLAMLSIAAKAQLTANFTANIVSGCTPLVVRFTDQSTGNPTRWQWDLGNRTNSNLQHPSVTYFTPGIYTVKLIVYAGNLRDSVVKTGYIQVLAVPVVAFTASRTTGCNPMSVNFTDQSTAGSGTITKWQWDFGDGNIDSSRHPSHVYTQNGANNVTLQVVNSGGCVSTLRKPGYINTSGVKASFTQRVLSSCNTNKIVFKSTSTGNAVLSTQWFFGDGSTATSDSVVHAYTTGGTYTVTLVVRNQAGCVDSVSTSVAVQSSLNAFFSADRTTGCRTPHRVNFSNESIAGTQYSWNFGDGTNSTAANPFHSYFDSGLYTVKLIVRHPNGCADSFTRPRYIQVQRAANYLENLPDSGCAPFTKSFSASLNSNVPLASVLWQFGDGATSSEPVPTHTYNNFGRYRVALITTTTAGCKDTLVSRGGILVSPRPTAAFSASPLSTCGKDPVQFTNLSSNASQWFWVFGDDQYSTDLQPSYVYTDTGWMNVSLVAQNGGCTDTAIIENYIYVKPAVAKFDVNIDCRLPMQRDFKNYSKGGTRFAWDFGDGTTSTQFEPSHIFPRAGFYTVTLSAFNDSTGCDYQFTKVIRIIDVTPNFTVSDTLLCRGTAIQFVASPATGEGVSRYSWNFGDGALTTPVGNPVSYTFRRNGTYDVKLVIRDSLGCSDSIVKRQLVRVYGPRATFAVRPSIGCLNVPVVFSDNSTPGTSGAITSRMWLYGDGLSDTVRVNSVTHTFTAEGSYRVMLKLLDSSGCTDSFRIASPYVITRLKPQFTVSDTSVCPGVPISFNCAYTLNGLQYYWDFGDGTTSTLQRPTHTYQRDGQYTVKLVLSNPGGCMDSSVRTNLIRIAAPTADFNMSDSFRVCPPLLIQFTNHSQNAVSEFWDFGDSTSTNVRNPSHFYANPGIYIVTLYSTGLSGCISSIQRRVEIKGPRGTFSYTPLRQCKPFDVRYTANAIDASAYVWDFNDGTTYTGTETTVSHTYQDSGKFVPKIILIDDAGCRVAIRGRDTLRSLYAKSAFGFSNRVLCDTGTVSFVNNSNSNDSIAAYRWNFGDGQFSFAKTPTHQYRSPGQYFPALQVTTASGCTDNFRSVAAVRVSRVPNIAVAGAANGCVPLAVQLQGVRNRTDTTVISSWQWKMSNGDSVAGQQSPPQIFSSAGNYSITLTATSRSGCVKSVEQRIVAYAIPTLQLRADSLVCLGKAATLSASGAARYQWNGASGIACDTCVITSVIPTSSGYYVVKGTSPQGCVAYDSVLLSVKQPFTLSYSSDTILCAGQAVQLKAAGADRYEWWPATGLSNVSTAAATASPLVTTRYQVIGSDAAGCFKDTGFVKVTVNALPQVDAGADKQIMAGDPIDLVPTISADVTEVRWTPTGDIFRNNESAITVRPAATTEYTVRVKNAGGCMATDKVLVKVQPGAPSVFLPNLFSPNGDGVNDLFYPRGTGVFKVRSFAVFNRWGQVIFQRTSFNTNDPGAGWDGTYKGGKMPADTYVYILESIGEDGSIMPQKGNITLAR